MKIAHLATGMRVAVKNYKSYSSGVVCQEAIVIDPAYWTRTNDRYAGCVVTPRKRSDNYLGHSRSVWSGVPVALLDVTGVWRPSLVAPNQIVSTWAAYEEDRAARIAAFEAELARRNDESARVDAAIAALNEVLAAHGAAWGAYRLDGKIVLTTAACEALAALLESVPDGATVTA